MWIYQNITNYKLGIPAIIGPNKAHTIICIACNSFIGYVFIDCIIEFKELEGKYGLLCINSNNSISLSEKINKISNELYRMQDYYKKINDDIYNIENKILQIISITAKQKNNLELKM